MKTKRSSNEPQEPPPWLDEFSKDLRNALADTADDTSPFPDLPDGVPFCDKLGHVQATYLKKRKRRDGLPRP